MRLVRGDIEPTAKNDTTEPRASKRGEERTRERRQAYVDNCLGGRGWHSEE
jgi:hypothetical protein